MAGNIEEVFNPGIIKLKMAVFFLIFNDKWSLMNKVGLFSFILFFSFVLNAQHTLTASFNTPVSGDLESRLAINTLTLALPDTGMSKYWNYSVLNSTVSIITYTYIDPSSNSQLPSYFPNSNLAKQSGDSSQGVYYVYTADSTGLYYNGYAHYSGSGYSASSGWYVEYKYPFKYGNSFAVGAVLGYTLSACGTGTLALPSFTFENVLLLRRYSWGSGGPNTYSNFTREYYFHSSDSKFPLMYIEENVYSPAHGSPSVSRAAYVNGDYITGIGNSPDQPVLHPGTSLDIYPSPVESNEGIITIQNGKNVNEGTLLIYNSLGEKIFERSILQLPKKGNDVQLHIGTLPVGHYYLLLESGDTKIIKKLVIR